jgi:hypothetical protein
MAARGMALNSPPSARARRIGDVADGVVPGSGAAGSTAGCLPGLNEGRSRPDSRSAATALEGISRCCEAFPDPE